MNVRTRKAVGCFAFLAYLTIYALLAASLGVALFPILPAWAQLIYYAIAGIVWIFPLKPLFGWMNKAQSRTAPSRELGAVLVSALEHA